MIGFFGHSEVTECVIQMASGPTTLPSMAAWLVYPWCPLLSPPRQPWLHHHCSRESDRKARRERIERERQTVVKAGTTWILGKLGGEGQTTPFLPTFSIVLVGLLPSSFFTSFLRLSLPPLLRTAMAQPATEMSRPSLCGCG